MVTKQSKYTKGDMEYGKILMEQSLRRSYNRNQFNFWNFVFGVFGTIFLVFAIIDKSLIKLLGCIVFFYLATCNSK